MDERPLRELRLRDFRCFHGEQTARLAPLTLLVGENGTGKTSFLAAVRATLEAAQGLGDPGFRAPPYDLGSFPEIAYRQNRNGQRAGRESFGLGCQRTGRALESVSMDATFTIHDDSTPTLATIHWGAGDVWMRELKDDIGIEFGCGGRSWCVREPADVLEGLLQSGEAASNLTERDRDRLLTLLVERGLFYDVVSAGAPIKSTPIRTYDQARLDQDPQGTAMPAFLAGLCFNNTERWQLLQRAMEAFGRSSGLFDQIFVKHLGKLEFYPFQLEVRKWGKKRKGQRRNLIDAGYGLSQIMPILVELLGPSETSLFLLQQPEVHLHPSAQAALGSLFCSVAAAGRQLVIETHSDYVIDRVLLDIRDKRTKLKADDVSILYFERGDSDVSIHSIRIDAEGNLVSAPEGYRQFFKDELNRVIDY